LVGGLKRAQKQIQGSWCKTSDRQVVEKMLHKKLLKMPHKKLLE
jgi:hypothetical protein